ncbi:hypothetical protein ABEF95_003614 [Exophiala dermatitidis]
MWTLLDEHDLKELLARLDTMILSISVLQGTFNLNINMAILDQLKASGQQIDPARRQEIKYLKKRIKLLKQECAEAQRRFEDLRAVRVDGGNTAFSDQVTQARFIHGLIERIEEFADEQVSASTMLEGSSGAATTSAGGSKISSGVQAGQEARLDVAGGPPIPAIHGAVMDAAATADSLPSHSSRSERFLRSPVEEMVILSTVESLRRSSLCSPSEIVPGGYSESEGHVHQPGAADIITADTEQEAPPEPECMFVIHDDGTLVTEEWRQPRAPPPRRHEVNGTGSSAGSVTSVRNSARSSRHDSSNSRSKRA